MQKGELIYKKKDRTRESLVKNPIPVFESARDCSGNPFPEGKIGAKSPTP